MCPSAPRRQRFERPRAGTAPPGTCEQHGASYICRGQCVMKRSASIFSLHNGAGLPGAAPHCLQERERERERERESNPSIFFIFYWLTQPDGGMMRASRAAYRRFLRAFFVAALRRGQNRKHSIEIESRASVIEVGSRAVRTFAAGGERISRPQAGAHGQHAPPRHAPKWTAGRAFRSGVFS